MGDHRNDRFADGWYVGLQSGTSKPVRGGFENIELTCRQNTGVTSVWQEKFNGGAWFLRNQGETIDSLLERIREQVAIERQRPAGPPAGQAPVRTADDTADDLAAQIAAAQAKMDSAQDEHLRPMITEAKKAWAILETEHKVARRLPRNVGVQCLEKVLT